MRVLFATSEATPFIKTGGLADVCGELPICLAKKGVDVSVVLPLYSSIPQKFRKDFEFIKHFDIYLGNGKQYAGIFKYIYKGVTFYFIDNEKYFARSNVYGYDDEGERFAFYDFAFIELISHLQLRPDIVHCNDWQTGMIPVLYYEHYKNFEYYQDIKFIMTVHNPAYQGNYPPEILDKLFMMNFDLYENGKLRFNNCLSYLKAGLVYADRITTVSRTYKNDLCSFEGGYGLQSIFSYRYKDFYGIVNGIDYEQNNPKTDTDIFYQYDRRNINNKKKNKVEFQKKYGLPVDENIPLIAMVSRLTWQKGLDIFFGSIERILEKNVQLLVVGSGDYEYEQRLSYLQTKYPNKMYVFIGYQASLAKLAYAASDYFLMPSLFEPCGISQLIALRYGSLPIVREVGGLVDTVTAYNEYTKEGTGFSFKNYSSDELYNTVNYALSFYNTDDYKLLVKNAMGQDFSWEKSTVEYIALYKSLLK